MNKKLKLAKVNIKMSLITTGKVVCEKVCKTEYECMIFERDMPAKHGFLFSGKPYAIGKTNLDYLM